MAEYIEREAFLEHMKKTSRYFAVKFDIEEFPAADVAPVVHGKWIFDFEFTDSNLYRCSVCGRQVVLFPKENICECYPYCHCGADMRERRKDG